jgi:hypothetical protein
MRWPFKKQKVDREIVHKSRSFGHDQSSGSLIAVKDIIEPVQDPWTQQFLESVALRVDLSDLIMEKERMDQRTCGDPLPMHVYSTMQTCMPVSYSAAYSTSMMRKM